MARRLYDGRFQKNRVWPGFGMRSRIYSLEHPTKREYKRMKKKGMPVPPLAGERYCTKCGQPINRKEQV